MSQTLNRSYDRAISIEHLQIISPQIIRVKGVCHNLGTEPWEKIADGKSSARSYSIRFSLFQEGFPFPLISKEEEISVATVFPDGMVQFLTYIPIPYVRNPEFSLEIDVLRSGTRTTTFCELGSAPAKLSFRLSAPQSGDYIASFSELLVVKRAGQAYLLSGTVKNIGLMPWESKNRFGKGTFLLGLKIYQSPNFDVAIFEERAHLESQILKTGEVSDFLASIPAQYVAKDMILKLNILKEEEFWFDEQGGFAHLIDLTDSTIVSDVPRQKKLAPYAAEVWLSSCSVSHGFIVSLTGIIKNSGFRIWNSLEESKESIIVGVRIYRSDSHMELVKESRSSLTTGTIKPGDEVSFVLSFLTLELEQGYYLLEVDLLSEHQFWFSQKGGEPLRLSIEVTQEAAAHKNAATEPGALNFLMPRQPKDCAILVLAPTLPYFDSQAGGKRLFEILKILAEYGFKVTYTYESLESTRTDSSYKSALETLGIEVHKDPISFLGSVSSEQFQVCILAWHDCASRHLSLIRSVLPQAKVIIDTVDIEWVRESRGAKEGLLDLTMEKLTSNKLAELSVYKSADLLWIVTEDDRQAVQVEDSHIQSILIPLIYDSPAPEFKVRTGTSVLFIGGFAHPPNVSAAIEAAAICTDFAKQNNIEIKLFIIGEKPPKEIADLNNDSSIVVTGRVEDLSPYLNEARAMLAPLRFGAGLKGKICDAAYAGIPILTTSIGAEGLGFEAGRDFLLAETRQEFVNSLKEVFNQDRNLVEMCINAYHKTSQLVGKPVVATTILRSLTYAPIVIAIVTYNKLDLLKKCLLSIIEKTHHPDYLIAVLSNGCTDGTIEYLNQLLKEFPDLIRILKNSENEFFVRPNNHIMDAFPDRDVILINNDIEIVNNNWLIYLYNAAYSSPHIGAAGGLLLSPEGLVSEAGAMVHANGYCENIGRGLSPNLAHLQVPRIVDYCSGCFLYLRRDAIREIRVFDDRFHPMYYEDVDWQMRLQLSGRATLYTPLAQAVHYEGSSAGNEVSKGMKRFQEINRIKFVEKFPK